MPVAYYSTRDLCVRFRCSSRTLFRRMKRTHNPFPAPCMRHKGSCNLWDAADVTAWEQIERMSALMQREMENRVASGENATNVRYQYCTESASQGPTCTDIEMT